MPTINPHLLGLALLCRLVAEFDRFFMDAVKIAAGAYALMPGIRFIAVTAFGLAAAIGGAAAQPGFAPMTAGPQQPGFVAVPAAQPPQGGGMPPCANEFIPLREQVQKDGLAVKAAIDKKAERSEICNRLKRFATAEGKFIKYLETNAGWCGIPAEAIQQVKASHVHSSKLRDQACAAGPTGPRIAPGPGLSDALGTSRAAVPDTSRKGASTFDTLSGNSLKQ